MLDSALWYIGNNEPYWFITAYQSEFIDDKAFYDDSLPGVLVSELDRWLL